MADRRHSLRGVNLTMSVATSRLQTANNNNNNNNNNKGKVHPVTGHKSTEGEQKYTSTLSLTSALYRVGGQHHALAVLALGNTHCIGGWVGPRAGLDGCGKFRPPEIRSPDRPVRSQSLYRLLYPGP